MKTYKLTFSETIHYYKNMEIEENKNPSDVLMEEINDLSDWKIGDIDTLYSDIEELTEQTETPFGASVVNYNADEVRNKKERVTYEYNKNRKSQKRGD